MKRCGLLGEKLGHSYSPYIHKELGDYSYNLFEKKPEEVEAFLKSGELDGMNVTIPYKKTVFPFLDEVSELAQEIGAVNTIVRRADGTLYGDNTDVYGFTEMVRYSGIEVAGKKVLVLGNGGASKAVQASLRRLNANFVIISRSGENNYENLDRHADAEVIVNTTPVGMFPKTGESPVDLDRFESLSGVLDIVYNPSRTEILLQAAAAGIPSLNGLYMLVAQAKKAAELFTGTQIPDSEIERIYRQILKQQENIVLIGMPGVGKSTIGRRLAEATGKTFLDADQVFTEKYGISPAEVITNRGEAEMRFMETEVMRELGMKSSTVIATGGGVITRAENYKLMHQNGTIVWLRRDLSGLSLEGRPLSKRAGVQELFAVRKPLYEKFCDVQVSMEATPDKTTAKVLKLLTERE